MVSLSGAQNAAPLVAHILALQDIIAQLQAGSSGGNIVITKISVEALTGASSTFQTFLVNYKFTKANSVSIGTSILNALNAELTAAQSALAAIT